MTATPTGRDVIWRLSLLYAASFLMFRVQIPFLPVSLGPARLYIHVFALSLAPPRLLFLTLASPTAIAFKLAAFGLVSIVAAFYGAPMRPLARAPAPREAEQTSGRVPWLLIVVFAASALIQASHALVNTFGSLHWAREG